MQHSSVMKVSSWGDGPLLEILSPSQSRPKITEITCNVFGAGGAPVIGIAPSTTPGTPSEFNDLIPDDSSARPNFVQFVTDWMVRPTVTNYIRRATIPILSTGMGFYTFRFPRGLVVPASGSVSIWAIAGPFMGDFCISVDS